MIRKLTTSFVLLISTALTVHSQNKEEATMRPAQWLGIWDYKNSIQSFNMDSMGYGDLPTSVEYRGIPVEAVKWEDKAGKHIVLLTQTGPFREKQVEEVINEKAELYAYQFTYSDSSKTWLKQWKVYDFVECFGVDMYIGFYSRSMTITDIDKDGIAEVTILYTSSCRGDVSPATKKLIMYEGVDKYAIRGETVICNATDLNQKKGDSDTADQKLKDKKEFYDFAMKRWNAFLCDEFKQYR
jgi:hypothetical protein